MELQEQVNALQSENKAYKDFLENVNAEKVALDQMLVENLKSSLQIKKEAVLNDEKIKKLKSEIEVLKKEKEVLQKQIENDFIINENKPS